jgi:hypothetical protein
MNPPSNPQTHNPNLIRLYQLEVLGTFRIAEDRIEEGRETRQSQTIKGRKRQALLACLLEARIAGREEVSKTELIDSLLNEVPETQGLNALRIEVHRLRLRLHPSVIETTINGYRLGQISSDAELFLEGKDTRLWRGAYLDGIHFNRGRARPANPDRNGTVRPRVPAQQTASLAPDAQPPGIAFGVPQGQGPLVRDG